MAGENSADSPAEYENAFYRFISSFRIGSEFIYR